MGGGGLIIRRSFCKNENRSALAAVTAATSAAAASSFTSLCHKPSSLSLPIAADVISKRYQYDNAHYNDNSRDMTASRLSDYSRHGNTTIIPNAKRSFSSDYSSSDDNQNNIATPSSSSQKTATTLWQPNQTTTTFTKMLNNNVSAGNNSNSNKNCKEIIKAYAQCVITKQNEGILTKGVCEKEYNALMECFRAARVVD